MELSELGSPFSAALRMRACRPRPTPPGHKVTASSNIQGEMKGSSDCEQNPFQKCTQETSLISHGPEVAKTGSHQTSTKENEITLLVDTIIVSGKEEPPSLKMLLLENTEGPLN